MNRLFGAVLLGAFLSIVASVPGYAQTIEDQLVSARKKALPVFLEVGATTCIPCKKMQPIMKQIESEHKGKILVLFLDVKKERGQALKLGVLNIPTQIFYDRNGKEVHRHLGFYPYEEIMPVLKKMGL